LRKNKEAVQFFKSHGIKSIDEDMLWPDAWKLSIKIKDLTPNNFNTYIHYFNHGFGDANFKLLSTQNSEPAKTEEEKRKEVEYKHEADKRTTDIENANAGKK
jgi:hypothetical protein